MPTKFDKQEAQRNLQRSTKHREKRTLAFVHYECGTIGEDSRVHAIAVKIPGVVETELFSAKHGEKKMLEQFAGYITSKRSSKYLWCVWGMRNADYGFSQLDARLHELTKGKSGIATPDSLLDLSNTCWQLHGDIKTGAKKRLPFLCEVNSICTHGTLDCDAIQDAVKNSRWPAVSVSVHRKVEMIYAIWDRMIHGSLEVCSADASSKPNETVVIKSDGSAPRVGVSLRDAARLIRGGDPEGQAKLINQWRNSGNPKLPPPIGKHPRHSQQNLYEPAALVAFLKKIEGDNVDRDWGLTIAFRDVCKQPRKQ